MTDHEEDNAELAGTDHLPDGLGCGFDFPPVM